MHDPMAPSKCPCCDVAFELHTERKSGGRFLGCKNFPECKVTYSFSDGKLYGLPYVVARESKKRSRVISLREQTITILIAMRGLSREEAEEFLDTFGLPEVQRLITA